MSSPAPQPPPARGCDRPPLCARLDDALRLREPRRILYHRGLSAAILACDFMAEAIYPAV